MGLDMYLEKLPRNKTREELEAESDEAWEKGLGYWRKNIRDVREVGYWRKVNWLHGFIVDTFADGVDKCQEIELSRADVETIFCHCVDAANVLSGKRLVCQKVVGRKGYNPVFEDDTSVEPIVIDFKCGYRAYSEGLWDKTRDRYWKVEDCVKEKLNAMLPPKRGFFFGTYEYDMWYVCDLCQTISTLASILEGWDDNCRYVYQASW